MDNFIGIYSNSVPAETCSGLIQLFDDANKRKLTVAGRAGGGHRKALKDSTDLGSGAITPVLREKYGRFIDNYLQCLMQSYKDYQGRYEILVPPDTYQHGVFEFNIQRYYPGGQAYYAWHYESSHPKVMDRVLAWMSYLNTVETGGETEFQYYNLSMKPEAGKTLIWPAGFTHTHRGCPAPNETKFIITGWFRFVPQ